jgi:3beta-hydroxy-delta5-steroid dehydrogenase/steroid delta-isomerase
MQAAAEAGVSRLVHTSSNNVTLDGPVLDGDESTPYAYGARDIYTETKIRGEQIVLGANDKAGLLTCAVRPGGIYGPGDPLMLPRMVEQLARGVFVATIGDGSALSDNTFIDNLVDGEICAARHLVPDSPACGQAYYVTDGAPLNYFEFFRPFVEGLGYDFPRFKIPAWPLRGVAWLGEWLHVYLGLPAPPLSRLELRKIVVSHYNRIDKARRELGWEPPVGPEAAVERCLPYCRELLDGANDTSPRLG